MRFVILHYHILKNAGSTIEDILDRSFGDRFARVDTPDRNGILSASELLSFIKADPQLLAVSSHHIRHPLPVDPQTLFFDVCFVRDPIDRVRSMYDYFRKRPVPGDGPSDLANSAAPGDFVKGMVRDFPLQIQDVQVNLIAEAGDSENLTQADLAIAIDRLRVSSFPGVVDCFDESIVAGEYSLRHVFPQLNCALPAVNVSGGLKGTVESRTAELRQLCEPEIFAELLRINELDFELVAQTRKEVLRRYRNVPQNEMRRRAFAERVSATGPAPVAVPRVRKAALRPLRAALARTLKPLFDEAFYLDRYPDVKNAGLDPMLHYLVHGSAEGRKPHPWFQPDYYLLQCPEAGCGNGYPLRHFLSSPPHEIANPHRLFDCIAYLREHPQVLATRQNPLLHFLHARQASESARGFMVDDVMLDPAQAEPHSLPFVEALNRDQAVTNS